MKTKEKLMIEKLKELRYELIKIDNDLFEMHGCDPESPGAVLGQATDSIGTIITKLDNNQSANADLGTTSKYHHTLHSPTEKRIIEIIDKQFVESKRYFAGFSHRESDKTGVYFPVLNPNPLEAQLFELDYTKDPGKQIHFELILKNLQTLNIKYSIKILDYKIYNVEE